jgi:hypothetical protein
VVLVGTQNGPRKVNSKACAHRFPQKGTGLYQKLGQRPSMLYSGKELVYILSRPKTLREAECKGDRLINLTEETSRQSSSGCGMVITAAFCHVYREKYDKKIEWKDLKICNFFSKSLCKVGVRKTWFLKRLAALLKRSQVLPVRLIRKMP